MAKLLDKGKDINKAVLSLDKNDINTEGREVSRTVAISGEYDTRTDLTLCDRGARQFGETMANEVQDNDFYKPQTGTARVQIEAIQEPAALDEGSLNEDIQEETGEKHSARERSTGEEPAQKKIKTEVKEESDQQMMLEEAVANARLDSLQS